MSYKIMKTLEGDCCLACYEARRVGASAEQTLRVGARLGWVRGASAGLLYKLCGLARGSVAFEERAPDCCANFAGWRVGRSSPSERRTTVQTLRVGARLGCVRGAIARLLYKLCGLARGSAAFEERAPDYCTNFAGWRAAWLRSRSERRTTVQTLRVGARLVAFEERAPDCCTNFSSWRVRFVGCAAGRDSSFLCPICSIPNYQSY